ncbi:TRAFAC clade GTPase domain-containing protein [Corynebacterium glutamicum]|uniref:TRAFAC clade GTPase domain-containing protein n=1 Tax=Corynebacterium glutamicum TaxID=1718 RepID=UPI0007616680|nr:hypothetical protein [Corynebacterium glutamicum]
MDDFLLILLAFTLGAAVLVFVLWVLLATAVRVLSYIVMLLLVVSLVLFVVGLLVGVVLPLFVFAQRTVSPLVTMTPDKVRDGEVIRGKQTGENQHYGWDWAWPLYLPYQAKHDFTSVIRQYRYLHMIVALRMGMAEIDDADESTTDEWKLSIKRRVQPRVSSTLVKVLLALPYFCLIMGLYISMLGWTVVYRLALFLGSILLSTSNKLLSWADSRNRNRRRAKLHCKYCYAVSTMPSYQCPNCKTNHHNIRPGPLGLLSRICGCGTRLPNTVNRASAVLEPSCPACGQLLMAGSGGRPTLLLPVLGARNSGKTMFLGSALNGLKEHALTADGDVEPLDQEAKNFVLAQWERLQKEAATQPTSNTKPVGKGYVLRVEGLPEPVEVQIMDVAGEQFTSADTIARLQYLRGAEHFILTVDPFADPDMKRLRESKMPAAEGDHTDDQMKVYTTFSSVLRAGQIDLSKKKLTVVISRVDQLQEVLPALNFGAMGSEKLREWLNRHGFNNLVDAISVDFPTAAYVAVDSFHSLDFTDHVNPVHVIEEILASVKMFPQEKLLRVIEEREA